MSIRLYVGNLPKELERQEFEAIFSEWTEDLVSIKLISDKKTGKCRGFGFVTVKTEEKADELLEKFSGFSLNGTPLKIEKALPRSKGKADANVEPGGGDSGSRRRKSSNKKSSASSSGASVAAQPDPRWADELEKLKQMLAAQASGT